MIISDHAKEEMLKDSITEDEVRQCLEYGNIEIAECVHDEMRYGRRFAFKDRSIMVVYTLRNNEERIITVYSIRKKKWQK